MKSTRFWLRFLIITAILAAALAGCGEKGPGGAEPIGPQPVETEPSPKAVAPQPGAKVAGDIQMGDKAAQATLLLTVSEDGMTITSVMASFSELKCEGFSAGSSSSSANTSILIRDGQFDSKAGGVGELSGYFTSPTTAKGTVHLLLEILGSEIECGTWDWSTGE